MLAPTAESRPGAGVGLEGCPNAEEILQLREELEKLRHLKLFFDCAPVKYALQKGR
jgi:hypothetical protein